MCLFQSPSRQWSSLSTRYNIIHFTSYSFTKVNSGQIVGVYIEFASKNYDFFFPLPQNTHYHNLFVNLNEFESAGSRMREKKNVSEMYMKPVIMHANCYALIIT